MSFMRYVPEGKGISAVYAFDPFVWDPFLEFTHNLMRGPSPLSVGERELIAAYVSALNACAYCAGAHGAAAAEFGFSEEFLKALVEDVESAPATPKLRTLLKYLHKLTVNPTTMQKGDVDALVAAGWSDTSINHAIAIAARYTMATRISHAHGIVVEEMELRKAGKRMADPEWTCLPESRRG